MDNWRDFASCKELPPSTFFEDFENGSVDDRAIILAVCDSCPVKEFCLQTAHDAGNADGVWGGVFFRNGVEKNPWRLRRRRAEPESKQAAASPAVVY